MPGQYAGGEEVAPDAAVMLTAVGADVPVVGFLPFHLRLFYCCAIAM